MQNNDISEVNYLNHQLPKAIWIAVNILISAYILFFNVNSNSILNSISSDYIIIFSLTIASVIKGSKWSEHLLWIVLSREIHLSGQSQLFDIQSFFSISWVISSILIVISDYKGYIAPVLFYHASLIFDPGSAQSSGLGMQLGFAANPLFMMLLSCSFRQILSNEVKAKITRTHLLFLFGFLWLLAFHSTDQMAYLNGQYILTLSTITLFIFCNCENRKQWLFFLYSLLAGGFFVGFASIAIGLLSEPNLVSFFEKRIYIQGLHPNMISTWALSASLLIYSLYKSEIKSSLKFMLITFCFILIVLSGSRLILMIFSFVFAWLLLFSQTKFKLKHVLIFLIPLLSLAAIRIFQSANLLEWTHNDRFLIWNAAIQLIKQSPLIGWGALSFGALPQAISDKASILAFDWNNPHTHQGLLEFALWGGIPFLILALYTWYKTFRDWSKNNAPILFIGLSLTVFGDFPWVKPGMISLLLLFIFAPSVINKQHTHSINLKKNGLAFLTSILFIFSMIGLINLYTADSLYQASFRSFQTHNTKWIKQLHNSIKLQPKNMQVRLSEFLWKFSYKKPSKEDLISATKLRKDFPSYYVVWFLEGRISYFLGNYKHATYCLEQSLKLDSRDLTGIRTALYVLAKHSSSKKLIWEAAYRGKWGLPLLINHPVQGKKYNKILSKMIDDFHTKDIYTLSQLIFIQKQAIKNDLSITMNLLHLPKLTKTPFKLIDSIKAIQLRLLLNNNKIDKNSAIHTLQLSRNGPEQYRLLLWLSLKKGRYQLAEKAFQGILKTFNFRNKDSEDLASDFLVAQVYLAENKFGKSLNMLNKLLSYDFTNPFIYKLFGDVYKKMKNKKLANEAYSKSLRYLYQSRTDPFFIKAPRSLLWPEGDEWTLMLEKTIRKHAKTTFQYNRTKWDRLKQEIVASMLK